MVCQEGHSSRIRIARETRMGGTETKMTKREIRSRRMTFPGADNKNQPNKKKGIKVHGYPHLSRGRRNDG